VHLTGRLFVKVVRAENLPAMDFSGTSDPYAVLRFKEEWLAYVRQLQLVLSSRV